jgi:hypothetical protein
VFTVSESATHPLLPTLRWLAQHTRFPASRLAAQAETLLLVAAAAQADEAEDERQRFLISRRDGAKDSALRAHAMRRSLAHYKCDNSAKV